MAVSVGIGLEIGEDQIRAVQLRRAGPGLQVLAAGAAPMPAGAVRGGIVQDGRLLAEGVRRVLRENRISGPTAVVGLSGRALTSRVVELPPMRRAELRAVVSGEMEHYRMIPPGQGTFDFVALGGEGAVADGQVRLLLMAADKKIVDAYREGLRLAGLQMTALEPLSLAASRAVYPSLATGGVAVVVVGARTTELAIFQSGALQYCRQLDTGTLDLLPPLVEPDGPGDSAPPAALGDDPLPTESLLAGGRLAPMAGEGSATLHSELRRSLDFYHREAPPGTRVERVLLSVESARLPDLARDLGDSLGLPTFLCQPFEGRSGSGVIPGEAGAAFCAATGLALRGMGEVLEAPSLDLSDTGLESRLAKAAPRWLTYALLAAIVLVMGSALSWFLVGNARQARERELAAKKRELAQVTQLELERTSAARRAQEAQSIVQLKGLPWSGILFQIAEFVPRGVWVTSVGTDKGNVLSLQGQALSADSVARLMDSLTRSRLFADPRMTSIQKAPMGGLEAVTYQIQVSVVPQPPPGGRGQTALPPAANGLAGGAL